MQNKINLKKKFQLFDECWSPKILSQSNGFYIKIFKAKGEFIWHHHENADEFFLVIEGQLRIKLKGCNEVVLDAGEFFVVPKGVEHLPYSNEEAHVMLFEPKDVVNTGNQESDKTVTSPEWI